MGISAPRDVLILRSELQKAVTVNQDAADTSPDLLAELESALAEHNPPSASPAAAGGQSSQ